MAIELFSTIYNSGLLLAFGSPDLAFAMIGLSCVGLLVLMNLNIFIALAFVSVPAVLMYAFLGFGQQSMIGMIILLLALMLAFALNRIISGR